MEFQMIMTREEHNQYSRCGGVLQLEVEKEIGRLLLEERLKRGTRVEEVCIYTKIKQLLIENTELGRCRLRWCVVAWLLMYYGKKLEIKLIDAK